MKNRLRGAIVVGLSTIIAGVAGALISNIGDLFTPNVKFHYERRPTDNIEIEIRHLMELTGERQLLDGALRKNQSKFFHSAKCLFLAFNPGETELWKDISSSMREEDISVDEIITTLIPIYKTNFTLSEIQQLNRLHSSDFMQRLRGKMLSVLEEWGLSLADLENKMVRRYAMRVNAELSNLPERDRRKVIPIAVMIERTSQATRSFNDETCPPLLADAVEQGFPQSDFNSR